MRFSVRPLIVPADLDLVLEGARRVAAGDRDRGLDRHVGDVGILAGQGDFAEDEERPVSLDLDGDMRLADIALAQLRGDRLLQVRGRSCPRAGTEPISGMVMLPPVSTA